MHSWKPGIFKQTDPQETDFKPQLIQTISCINKRIVVKEMQTCIDSRKKETM